MDSQRVQLKLFASDPEAVELEPFVPLFHRWIQNGTLPDELMIDVADYSHVHQGPGIVLIGHGSDYHLDIGEDRPGLLFSRKRGLEGDARTRLEDAFRRALRAAQLVEQDEQLGGKVRFGSRELLLRIPDRLHAPNEDETFEEVRPELERLLDRLFGQGAYTLEREGDARRPFTVRIRTGSDHSVGELLAAL